MNLIHGDCIEEMAKMPDSSVDAIVTDPPYGIEFMGKTWDSFGRKKEYKAQSEEGYGNKGILSGYGRGGLNKDRVKFYKRANEEFYEFSLAWALEAFRILKPGGHLLSFGGTRTFHRLACAVEDSGFEIRDSIAYMYGAGFPKSLDISKAIDKRNGMPERGAEFKEALAKAVKASKKPRKELDRLCGFTMRYDIPYDKDPIGWGCTLPGTKEWNVIKSVLEVEGSWDDFIEGAEREIVGKELRKNSPSGIVSVGRPVTDVEREITVSSTEAAKTWDGWGTALKPSYEPIIMARKPISENTVAGNVLKHGTGAINIDGCRVEYEAGGNLASNPSLRKNVKGGNGGRIFSEEDESRFMTPNQRGRWPANTVLSHLQGCVKIGQKKVKGDGREPQNGERPSGFYNVGSKKGAEKPSGPLYGNPDGTETVEDWRCAEGCPVQTLDEQSGVRTSGQLKAGTKRKNLGGFTGPLPETVQNSFGGDSGGASRFFYTSKAGSDERWYWCKECKTAGCFSEAIVSPDCAQHGRNPATADLGPLFGGTDTPICSCPPTPRDAHEGHSIEAHPTVKPVDLMSWLVRLVTPPGGTVLDPFLGSGTTAIAAVREGFNWIGIERSPEYVEIAKARLTKEGAG